MDETNGVYASGNKKPAKQRGSLEFPMRKTPSWRVRPAHGGGGHGDAPTRRSSRADSSGKGGRLHQAPPNSLGLLRRVPSSLVLLLAVLFWLLGAAFLKAYRSMRKPDAAQEVLLARGIYSGGRGQRQSLLGTIGGETAELGMQQTGAVPFGAAVAAHTGAAGETYQGQVSEQSLGAMGHSGGTGWGPPATEVAETEAGVSQSHSAEAEAEKDEHRQAAHASHQGGIRLETPEQRSTSNAVDSSGGPGGIGQGMGRTSWQGRSVEHARGAGGVGAAGAAVSHAKPPPRRTSVRRASRAQAFKVAVFSVPQCAAHASLEMHTAAVHSWLRLQQPPPDIFLIGSDPALESVASISPKHVHVLSDVDTNLEGVPQLHSVLARVSAVARAQAAEVILLVDPTVVLFPDILHAATKAASRFSSWLLAGASWHLPSSVQDIFVRELLKELQASQGRAEPNLEVMQEFTTEFGRMHAHGTYPLGFLMWNPSPAPLLPFPVPPFTMGRGSHEPWLLHHLSLLARQHQGRSSAKGKPATRQVIDASESVVSVRLSALRAKGSESSSPEMRIPRPKSWEFFANAHMALNSGPRTGAFKEGQGTLGLCPWLLAPCYEAPARTAQQAGSSPGPTLAMCLIPRVRPGNCSCEHSSYLQRSTTDVRLHENKAHLVCGAAQKEPMDYTIDPVPAMDSEAMGGEEGSGAGVEVVPGVPHTLEQLLARVGDQHRTVVLAVAAQGQAETTLNFACMLKGLGVGSFIVAALHKATYRELYVHGVPVYYAGDAFVPSAAGSTAAEQDEAHGAVWLRSSLALPILKQGYDVLLTDTDFVWLRNPVLHIRAFKNADIIVQSDEPNPQKPSNSPRRLNTGFMYLRARKPVLRAVRLIKDKASRRNAVAEKSCFYDALCGSKGNFLKGTDKCRWQGPKLETLFLSRKLYPNGALYRRGKGFAALPFCRRQGCYIVPSDRRSGKGRCPGCPTFFDPKSRMCTHPWMLEKKSRPTG